MPLFIVSFRAKIDREVFLIMASSHPGCRMLFVLVFDLDVLLNYLGNISSWVLLVITVGPNSMFKLIPNENQVQAIGTLIGLWEKSLSEVHSDHDV